MGEEIEDAGKVTVRIIMCVWGGGGGRGEVSLVLCLRLFFGGQGRRGRRSREEKE